MSKTNCCNCGAALDIFSPKCEFCGTKNINMTEIDLDSGEAANFIFKMPKNIIDSDGNQLYMSILAIPELEKMEVTSSPVIISGGWSHTKLACYNNRSFELGINLHAVERKNHELCSLTIR